MQNLSAPMKKLALVVLFALAPAALVLPQLSCTGGCDPNINPDCNGGVGGEFIGLNSFRGRGLFDGGDVDAHETELAEDIHGADHGLMSGAPVGAYRDWLVPVSARDFDQLVMAMCAERFGGPLMHRGRRRMRDRRADQAGEKAAVGRSKGAGGRAHDLVIGQCAFAAGGSGYAPNPARR